MRPSIQLPIRARLTLVSAALMALVVVALGTFLYVRVRADLFEAVDDRLRDRAAGLVQDATGAPLLAVTPPADPGDAFAQVLSVDGQVIESSPDVAGHPVLLPRTLSMSGAASFVDAQVQTTEEVVPARMLAVPSSDGQVIVVGASVDDQLDMLSRLLMQLLIGGPLAVLLASAAGWLVAGAALRPVERLRVEAEAISGSELDRRLSVPASGDELARLGDSLNGMLARLENAVERERRFVDDASHELRTPLANLRAELDLALRRARTPDELEATLRSAAEETERLTRLAEDLLVLARADRGRLPLRREDIDVTDLIRETARSFSGRAAEMGISLELDIEDGVRAQADAARIRQAVGNLIDNALQHTPVGGQVTVRVVDQGGILSVEVDDAGAGFAPSFLQRAFEPFSRADPARSRTDGGAGLGLAIVRTIAEAHGGTVEASNRPDGGATVVVRIPT